LACTAPGCICWLRSRSAASRRRCPPVSPGCVADPRGGQLCMVPYPTLPTARSTCTSCATHPHPPYTLTHRAAKASETLSSDCLADATCSALATSLTPPPPLLVHRVWPVVLWRPRRKATWRGWCSWYLRSERYQLCRGGGGALRATRPSCACGQRPSSRQPSQLHVCMNEIADEAE
jgi:hypothetical protein